MRLVWPTSFQLFWAQMTGASVSGPARDVAQKFFPKTKDSIPMPFGLRWSASPQIGFARRPFEVFRRVRRKVEKILLLDSFNVNVQGIVSWEAVSRELMYEVLFDVAPAGSLTVEPVDSMDRPILGQRLTFTKAGKGCFRAPGIWALRVQGSGILSDIKGTDQTTYANLPGWIPIERVGFPYEDGEIAPPHYTLIKQGFDAPSLSGVAAARIRLEILRMLHLQPPPSGIPNFPVPPWNAPDINKYLNTIRASLPGQLGLITKCLTSTNDLIFPSLQARYREIVETDGISQGNIPDAQPDPERPSQATIPVVHSTMLAVTGDSWVATALGYGTVDIPPLNDAMVNFNKDGDPDIKGAVEPGGNTMRFFDYMVTASYELFPGPFGTKVELAALAQVRPEAVSPAPLSTKLKQIHRPAFRDTKGSAAIRIGWEDPGFPQGYAIAVSRAPNTSSYLNSERVGNSGGFDAYVALTPARQDPDVAPELQSPSFTDLRAQVPFTGSSTSRYLVAGIDVFGQWSGWKPASFAVNPIPVCLPGLLSAEFSVNAAAAVGTNVPADLIIEFGWDWDDRSPKSILFNGAFFSIPTPVVNDPWPSADAVTGFQLTPGGPSTGTVVVGFTVTGAPTITSGHAGNVTRLTSTENIPEPAIPNDLDSDSNQQRRYRLRLSGFTCKFNASSRNAYCVYVRATETVAPARISDPVGPKVAIAFNPLRPPITPLAVVNWTAMADSTGRARALLTWTKDPSAKGYVIYEASEAQLRTLLNMSPPEAPPGTSWVARATALQNQIAAEPVKSLSAFVRLNMKLIDEGKYEIDLPGSATNIFAYQVAAVSDTNVESARSNASFWAVPRRMEPGIPAMLLRKENNQLKVIALPGGGVIPAGYRVFRVHKPHLASDLGLMGPPQTLENATGWRDHQEPQLHGGSPIDGKSLIDTTATPSWFPYYYRIVAVGPQNLTEGQHRGESQPSGVQSILLPPELSVSFVSGQSGSQYLVFRFSSNVPIKKTRTGAAKIEIFEIIDVPPTFIPGPPKPLKPAKLKRNQIFFATTDMVPVGAPFQILANPQPAFLASLPQLNRQAPNAQGVSMFSMAIKSAVKKVRIIRITDPLSRSIEVEFEV